MVRRVLFVTVALLIAGKADTAERRGGIAFHYARSLSAAELEWFSKFDVLVTHDPLPRPQADALRRRGTKLVLYEWAVAFYASHAGPWNKTAPVLNRSPLRGHLGALDADAYYYDPATREHQHGRARMLARRIRMLGYDGVFLDTTTAASVHPNALAEYQRRHPDVDYDEAFSEFLANLRRSVRVVVTNQGYRSARLVLPFVDWDVTESLITRPRDGRFVMRPWNDRRDEWNSIAFLMENLLAPARRRFPRVRFAHINYLDDGDREQIAEIVAITRLFDAEPVVAHPTLAMMFRSDLLLLDLGRPLPRIDNATSAYRFFERGFMGYNAGTQALRIDLPGDKRWEDAVTRERVEGRTVVVPPAGARILRTLP